jgi:hypothetical protein
MESRRATVLPWEDEGEYQTLLNALVAEHTPKGPTEEHLVEELAGIFWRKRRLRLAEAAVYRDKLRRDATSYAGGAQHQPDRSSEYSLRPSVIAGPYRTPYRHLPTYGQLRPGTRAVVVERRSSLRDLNTDRTLRLGQQLMSASSAIVSFVPLSAG